MNQANDLESAKTLTLIVYILQAITVPTGGLTAIVAVVINYVKLEDMAGTWLASHFRWQIRTFWFSMLWGALGGILAFTIVGIVLALPIWAATGIWIIYRIVKGVLRLMENKEMYVPVTV
jgi:uncharacterized membrane protein